MELPAAPVSHPTPALCHLTLTRPLCAVDTETTGPDPHVDRIVAVAVVRVEPDGETVSRHRLINPGRPIPAAATAVHGLTDVRVADQPPFRRVARSLAAVLTGADLVAFNAPFDLAVLAAEFARAGVPFDLSGRRVLDPLAVFRRHHPRTLAAAVRTYLGREHAAAHDALADARAALAVLDAQIAAHALPADPAGLHRALWPVDVGGKLAPAGGDFALTFGKHRGRPLRAVAAADPGYLRWLLRDGRLLPDAAAIVESVLGEAGPKPLPAVAA